MTVNGSDPARTVDCLRVVGASDAGTAERLAERVARQVDKQIGRWDAEAVTLDLMLKDRDTPQSKVTLEARIAVRGASNFVATSTLDDLDAAVDDVSHDVSRQVRRFVDKRISTRRG